MMQTLAEAVAEAAPGTTLEREVGYGHPAQVLVEQSADADLLVVGSRGHSTVKGMLLGSVSMHCVTHAHCPRSGGAPDRLIGRGQPGAARAPLVVQHGGAAEPAVRQVGERVLGAAVIG